MLFDAGLFEAVEALDPDRLQTVLDARADVTSTDENGLTALLCAACQANYADHEKLMSVLRLLVDAGSPLEAATNDGRTALYLLAELSPTVEPVVLLLDAGANADLHDVHGNHVLVNAMTDEVKALLSEVTGRPVPPPPLEFEWVKMKSSDWKAARVRIDAVFARLEGQGVIALESSGTTQSDGFDDCSQVFRARQDEGLNPHGFCYFTKQDVARAKKSSTLSLAFWGAPEGAPPDMERVGELVVEAFRAEGLLVDWNGSGAHRPTVYLRV